MRYILKLALFLLFLNAVLFANTKECSSVVDNYFKIFEDEDFDKFKDIFHEDAKELLKLHLTVPKLTKQKLIDWRVDRVLTSNDLDIFLIKSSWKIYNKNFEYFDSNLKEAFVLKKDLNGCKILKIYPSNVYDLIIKGYFFKKLLDNETLKDINNTSNLIKKVYKTKYKRQYTPPKVIPKYAVANIYLHNQDATEEWFKDWSVIKIPIDKDGKPKIISNNDRFGWYPKVVSVPRGIGPPPKPHGAILYLHPISPKEPSVLRRVLKVDPTKNILQIRASNALWVDWELVVKVDGKEVFDKIVKDFKWKEYNISLQEYDNRLVKIDVEIKSNNWWNEYAYIDEIKLIGALDTKVIDIKKDYDNSGEDYRFFKAKSYKECIKACNQDSKCKVWSFTEAKVKGLSARCWLKKSIGEFIKLKGAVSALKPN